MAVDLDEDDERRITEMPRLASVAPRERNTDNEARSPGLREITEAIEP